MAPRFVAEVEGLQGSCDVCLRLGDKRRERQHQQRRRRELFDRLRDGTLSAADLARLPPHIALGRNGTVDSCSFTDLTHGCLRHLVQPACQFLRFVPPSWFVFQFIGPGCCVLFSPMWGVGALPASRYRIHFLFIFIRALNVTAVLRAWVCDQAHTTGWGPAPVAHRGPLPLRPLLPPRAVGPRRTCPAPAPGAGGAAA